MKGLNSGELVVMILLRVFDDFCAFDDIIYLLFLFYQ